MSNSASLDRVGSGTGSVVDISPNTSTEDMTELAINQLHDTAESTAKEPQRSLPDRNVTADNFEDAYVQFIFYCNPSVPLLLPTAELRRGFKAVPRADGKFFETYTLFKLVQKLESGEISTWNSLVVELGVERPDPAKNQSTQKLGQYAVRCKVGFPLSMCSKHYLSTLGLLHSLMNVALCVELPYCAHVIIVDRSIQGL